MPGGPGESPWGPRTSHAAPTFLLPLQPAAGRCGRCCPLFALLWLLLPAPPPPRRPPLPILFILLLLFLLPLQEPPLCFERGPPVRSLALSLSLSLVSLPRSALADER